MIPQGVMPHPWWRFWQIGDFLIMLALLVFFVRYVRRSDARTRAEERAREESQASAGDDEPHIEREERGATSGEPGDAGERPG